MVVIALPCDRLSDKTDSPHVDGFGCLISCVCGVMECNFTPKRMRVSEFETLLAPLHACAFGILIPSFWSRKIAR